jgi:hypothetical protein
MFSLAMHEKDLSYSRLTLLQLLREQVRPDIVLAKNFALGRFFSSPESEQSSLHFINLSCIIQL